MKQDLNENKNTAGFKDFILKKHNIFSLIAIVSGILALVLFLVLPAIQFQLTPDGVAAIKTTPEMDGYHQALTGVNVLFGGCTVECWVNNTQGQRVLNTYDVLFNYIVLIGLIVLVLSIIAMVIMTALRKNNIVNKFILAGFIISAIMLILTPVFFYAVNTHILPSTRYDQPHTRYEFGLINVNADIGTVLGCAFGVIASIFAGLTLPKADEDSRH